MTEPFPNTELNAQLEHSIIPSDYVVRWCFVWNSPKAKFATVWINLLDSQQGTHASQLIGCHLFLNNAEVLIKGVKAHTSTPQCQQCWHWGHSTEGVAEATPKPLPPFPPPLWTCLALINMLLTTTTALTGSIASTGPGFGTSPSGMPWQEKGASDNKALPPINEEDEWDDDEMELFSLGLDDDYEFHK
ncbi:hypothetical protein P691DRAFT_784182 [Macrolepiota fuliginosa MF-IS2]|uniref:Uncharacterized protein n=1 Tax=Macrolepiota fuliginosa MF-IS2 TaxID=1400762 RepID=A0A9P6BVW0_9AGAR|nr:hypothetical protein P691DRAFT_784182 [Macrolepiota fuliginosa MF-IS2]